MLIDFFPEFRIFEFSRPFFLVLAVPGVLEAGLSAGDHVELVLGRLEGPVNPDRHGHAVLVCALKSRTTVISLGFSFQPFSVY